MAKVLFTIKYEIDEEKKKDFMFILKELKSVVNAEGLENYSVFEIKGKKNVFQEVYTFVSEEAFEEYDDDSDERVSILMAKLSEIVKSNSTQYTTLKELEMD